jgi:hypothetical protein
MTGFYTYVQPTRDTEGNWLIDEGRRFWVSLNATF